MICNEGEKLGIKDVKVTTTTTTNKKEKDNIH